MWVPAYIIKIVELIPGENYVESYNAAEVTGSFYPKGLGISYRTLSQLKIPLNFQDFSPENQIWDGARILLVFVDIRFYSKSALYTYFYLPFMGVQCLCSGLFLNLSLILINMFMYVAGQNDYYKSLGNLLVAYIYVSNW